MKKKMTKPKAIDLLYWALVDYVNTSLSGAEHDETTKELSEAWDLLREELVDKPVGERLEKLNPMPYEPQSWINTLWDALDHFREFITDDQWDEMCMAMAWTTEQLGCEDPIKLEED